MNRRTNGPARALTLLAFLFLTLVAGLAAAPAPPPLLQAQGTRLVAGGAPVQLKGTNLGGWLLQETWMSPVLGSPDHWTTRDTLTKRFGAEKADQLFRTYEDHWITTWDLDAIRDLGFNVVRVPFGYWNLQDEDGNWNRTASGDIDFGKLDWVVREAGNRGLYVLLDLHGAPGFASNEHSSGKVGGSRLFGGGARGEAARTRTEALWTEVARHFKDSPAVAGYDLLNEPMAKPDDKTLWDLYDRLYRAIRRVDPDHLVSMEAVWDLGNLPDPADYGWKNVLYQTHDYGWNQDQGAFVDAKVAGDTLMNDYQVPVLVGEFTAFTKFSDWDHTLAAYDRAGLGWTTWTWKLTKTGTTHWGVYSGTFVHSANVQDDSFEAIRDAWSKLDTSLDTYGRNDLLAAALQRSLVRPPYLNLPAAAAGAKRERGVRYEAEDAQIVLSSAHKPGVPPGTESQGFFSGRLAAGGLNSSVTAAQVAPDWSNLPHVRFTVKVEAAGVYQLVLGYNGDDDKTILVKVGDQPAVAVPLPQLSGGAWNLMHQKEMNVTLAAGDSPILVSGTLGGQGWENVDYIELRRIP